MSTHVVGFVPPDEEWENKLAAWRACRAVGCTPPRELFDFFGVEWETRKDPDPDGREEDIGDCVAESNDEDSQGLAVDVVGLAERHPLVKVVRFVNSW